MVQAHQNKVRYQAKDEREVDLEDLNRSVHNNDNDSSN